MDLWELREIVKKLIPRRGSIAKIAKTGSYIKEKGRKRNYRQFNLETQQMTKLERLLNKEEIKSFLELSLRSAHCPLSLNLDVWDGIRCPFQCQYCYADSFKASLYTSFFDNWDEIGLRHCNPDYFKSEMDKMMKYRGNLSEAKSDIQKALAMEMPLRFGIRFEDFPPIEAKKKISLEMLRYLASISYPVMINTKSDLLATEEYLKALKDNKAGAAAHITMISSDDSILKVLEPGAPSFERRLASGKILSGEGIRIVARIEPFMIFVNDQKDRVDEYIGRIMDAGIRHVTFDTYSYSAAAPGIRKNFESLGYDFERMFTLMSDCQWLGSLILGKFMDYLRQSGLKCSTFDFGNVPLNEDPICCNVGDWFKGYSRGNTTIAIRFIASRGTAPTTWCDYEKHVMEGGGWLSESLREEVLRAWNGAGNLAYFPEWAAGVEICGRDKDYNRVFRYNKEGDFRMEMLKEIA